jgi:hypothetical protein
VRAGWGIGWRSPHSISLFPNTETPDLVRGLPPRLALYPDGGPGARFARPGLQNEVTVFPLSPLDKGERPGDGVRFNRAARQA